MPITAQRLMQTIHKKEHPYRDFDFKKENVLQFKGWNSESPWLDKLLEEKKPKVIIETGSWLGGSAIRMANKCRELGLDTAVICIDTWLGDHYLHLMDQWRGHLKFKNARPNFYETFLSNVIDAELQDYIIPLSMPSVSGARCLAHLGIKAELTYIDASHLKGDVINDLRAFWKVTNVGGVMIGDDYKDHWANVPEGQPIEGHVCNFDGLIQDWNLFAAEVGLALTRPPHCEKCWIEKKAELNKV